MADYLAPFHMPKFSDEGFRERKAAYVEEHGYSITIPTFRDIVHVGLHKPITPAEKELWRTGKRSEIPHHRQIELEYQKERSRERYNKMLASPIPNWKANIVSFLTAWDDAQDAVISLAAIGRIACKFLPALLVGIISWPIGLLWFIATIMGLLVGPTACAINPIQCKRYMKMKLALRQATMKAKTRSRKGAIGPVSAWDKKMLEQEMKPWTTKVKNLAKYEKARLKAGFKGYASSGGYLPSFSEGIQMLQVTDQIWGIGLCLGPIVGMALDLTSGGIRWLKGEKVSFKNAPSDIEVYDKVTDKLHNYARWKPPKTKMSPLEFWTWKDKKIRSGTWGIRSKQDEAVMKSLKGVGSIYGFQRRTNFQEEAAYYTLAETSFQGVRNILDHWDPIINVEGLEHIQVEAYNNENPLISEMLIEEGLNPEEGIGWPVTGKRWQTYEEIQTTIAPVAAANIRSFSENCPSEDLKAIGEMSATAAGLQAIGFLVGEQNLEVQYHAAIDIAETLLDKGYSFPEGVTQEQMNEFALWTQAHQDNESRPDLREILGYAKNSLGFEFTTKG